MADEKILKKKVFKGKTLEDLYQEIHENIANIKETIEATLEQSLPHMKERTDVVLMLPIINNLLVSDIKNTANLTKMAEILTKAFSEKEAIINDTLDNDNVFNELDDILKKRKEKEEKVLLLNNSNDR